MNNTNQQEPQRTFTNSQILNFSLGIEPLLRRLIRPYRHLHMDDDLLQEARLGLLEAARHYKSDFGVEFTSYAIWWARKYIHAAVRLYGYPVALPEHPHSEDMQPALSLCHPAHGLDNERLTLADTLANDTTPETPVSTDINPECFDVEVMYVEQLLPVLNYRRQQIVRQYFGINTPPLTIEQIAHEMDMKPKAVYNILERSLQQLAASIPEDITILA